jgi:hypothetical protein
LLKPQLPVTFRKTRVEDQLQRADEVALANLVLTDDDDAFAGLDVDIREVREVANFYPRDAHASLPAFLLRHGIGHMAMSARRATSACAPRRRDIPQDKLFEMHKKSTKLERTSDPFLPKTHNQEANIAFICYQGGPEPRAWSG